MFPVFVGWDARETAAYMVCVRSLTERSSVQLDVVMLAEPHLRALGLYRRTWHRDGQGRKVDDGDGKPFSTDFAFTRFLVPRLASRGGWALFCDCDFLWRADVSELFALAEPRYAVMLVKHEHRPAEAAKMDGQAQQAYPRKNWSSLVLWNGAHPANRALTVDDVNRRPGRDLHGFAWLDDSQIGALPEAWNWLEGWSSESMDPKAVHFTRGTPDMPGYQTIPFADEWRCVRDSTIA